MTKQEQMAKLIKIRELLTASLDELVELKNSDMPHESITNKLNVFIDQLILLMASDLGITCLIEFLSVCDCESDKEILKKALSSRTDE